MPTASGSASEQANNLRECVVALETAQEQEFLHAPTPAVTPKRIGEPKNMGTQSTHVNRDLALPDMHNSR
jgi:hypothetical protein